MKPAKLYRFDNYYAVIVAVVSVLVIFSAYVYAHRTVGWYEIFQSGKKEASERGLMERSPSKPNNFVAVITASAADLNVGVEFRNRVIAKRFAAKLQRMYPDSNIESTVKHGITAVGFRDSRSSMFQLQSEMSFSPGNIVAGLRSIGDTGSVTLIMPRYLEGFINVIPLYQTRTESFYRLDQYANPDPIELVASLTAPVYKQYMLALLLLVLVGLSACVAGAWVVSKPEPDLLLLSKICYFPLAICMFGFFRLIFFERVMYLPAVDIWYMFDPHTGNSLAIIAAAFSGLVLAFSGCAATYYFTVSNMRRTSPAPENDFTLHFRKMKWLVHWAVVSGSVLVFMLAGTPWLSYKMVPAAFVVFWIIFVIPMIILYEKIGRVRFETGLVDMDWYARTNYSLNETGTRLASNMGVQNRPVLIGLNDSDYKKMIIRYSPAGTITLSVYLLKQLTSSEIEFLIARSLVLYRKRWFTHPEFSRWFTMLNGMPVYIGLINRNVWLLVVFQLVFVSVIISTSSISDDEVSVSDYKKALACTGDLRTALQATAKSSGLVSRDLSDFEAEELILDNKNMANLHKAALELGMAKDDKYPVISE
jgi:hypothetical protein